MSNNNPLQKRQDDRLRLRCQGKFDELAQAQQWVQTRRGLRNSLRRYGSEMMRYTKETSKKWRKDTKN